MEKEITTEEMCEQVFALLRRYFTEHPEIDKLNAQEKTREDLEEVIEDYYRVLNGEEI